MFAWHQGCVIASGVHPATGPGLHDRDVHDALLIEQRRFGELLAGYYDDVRIVLARRVPPDAADDVAQEVFLRLARRLRSGKPFSAPFGSVVWSTVRFAVADYRTEAASRPLADSPGLEWLASPDDPIADAATNLHLEQHIAALPPADARVVRLKWIEGCEIVDIARMVGCSRNAVDQALHRGRVALRKALTDGR